MTKRVCDTCGAELETYTVYDKDTHKTVGAHLVCPNEWRMNHPSTV
jgi:hypothetical protein